MSTVVTAPPPAVFRRRPARLLLAILLALFYPPLGNAQGLPAELLTQAGYGSAPIIRPRPGVLAVAVELNGQPARLVLDTGFDAVFLRREWVRRAGIPVRDLPGGTLRSHSGSAESRLQRGTLQRLRLGNVEVRGVPVFISDLGLFGATPRHSLRGDGFLGAHFLAACGAIIDLQHLRLYLRAPDDPRAAKAAEGLGPALRRLGMAEIPLTRAGAKYLVPASLNGTSARLVVDTGAYRTLLDRRAAARFQVTPRHGRRQLRTMDLGGRRQEAHATSVASFQLGGVPVRETRVLLADLESPPGANVAGLLGVNVLGNCGAIMDCGAARLYLAGRNPVSALAGTFDTPDPAGYDGPSPLTSSPNRVRIPSLRVPGAPRPRQ